MLPLAKKGFDRPREQWLQNVAVQCSLRLSHRFKWRSRSRNELASGVDRCHHCESPLPRAEKFPGNFEAGSGQGTERIIRASVTPLLQFPAIDDSKAGGTVRLCRIIMTSIGDHKPSLGLPNATEPCFSLGLPVEAVLPARLLPHPFSHLQTLSSAALCAASSSPPQCATAALV